MTFTAGFVLGLIVGAILGAGSIIIAIALVLFGADNLSPLERIEEKTYTIINKGEIKQ
jgi:hypothetical protein